MMTYYGHTVSDIELLIYEDDPDRPVILSARGQELALPIYAVSKKTGPFCSNKSVYTFLGIKYNLTNYYDSQLFYTLAGQDKTRKMPVDQIENYFYYLPNGYEEVHPDKYEIVDKLIVKGSDLKGKLCSIVKHYSSSNDYVFVEFEEDVGGGSADGAGKAGHCLLLTRNLLRKLKPKENKNVAKKFKNEIIIKNTEEENDVESIDNMESIVEVEEEIQTPKKKAKVSGLNTAGYYGYDVNFNVDHAVELPVFDLHEKGKVKNSTISGIPVVSSAGYTINFGSN